MDANWRPTQGTGSTMDTSDWRTQLQPGERLRIANKILDKFKRHRPVSDQDGYLELCKFALRFEEECYTAATSKSNYVRRLTLDVPTMENNTQNTMVDAMQSNAGIPMQSQVHNPGQSLAIPVPNQFQSRQQLLYQNIQNSIAPPVSNIGQTPIQNVVGPNSNVQNNMFGGSQRQMPPRQQVVPQQQQQLQNSQPYLYQQKQLQQKYLKHEILPGNIQHSLMQPNIQMQQLQQPNLQPNQLQSLQSSVMQTSSVMQPLITQTSDMQQRFQGSSSLLQRKNALDQQNQPYRSQKTLSDSSSNSLDSTAHTGKSDGDDWQEEVFQNIKSMKESYLPELTEMHQKIAAKL
ncbi:hypothetical protein QN277_024357 [Acacia crassicarpa]|uniref:Mediator complex subunit 15 KIX domain-containing protein n=1 Tax=Acacia crassicarpa TaxID=499986 RepID=A0AAE1JC22_9FABA|nr:hypothetical protein QN277_024357 [Acacia crassicarpa]